jgi:hypothetical protein
MRDEKFQPLSIKQVGRSGRGCLKFEGYLIRETAGWTLGKPPSQIQTR